MSLVDLPQPRADLRRVRVLMSIVSAGLVAIVARLWYLQIAHGTELWDASQGNNTRLIRRLAPRGRIQDRNGRVLASNRRQVVVSVVPDEMRKNPWVLGELAS